MLWQRAHFLPHLCNRILSEAEEKNRIKQWANLNWEEKRGRKIGSEKDLRWSNEGYEIWEIWQFWGTGIQKQVC